MKVKNLAPSIGNIVVQELRRLSAEYAEAASENIINPSTNNPSFEIAMGQMMLSKGLVDFRVLNSLAHRIETRCREENAK